MTNYKKLKNNFWNYNHVIYFLIIIILHFTLQVHFLKFILHLKRVESRKRTNDQYCKLTHSIFHFELTYCPINLWYDKVIYWKTKKGYTKSMHLIVLWVAYWVSLSPSPNLTKSWFGHFNSENMKSKFIEILKNGYELCKKGHNQTQLSHETWDKHNSKDGTP